LRRAVLVDHRWDGGVALDVAGLWLDRPRWTLQTAIYGHRKSWLQIGMHLVDDQQRHECEFSEILLAGGFEGRVCELFEQRVRLATDDPISLLNRRAADRLRQVTLAGAGRAEKEYVFALADDAGGRELVNEGAVHLLVAIKVQRCRASDRIAKACELVATLVESILATLPLVTDEGRDEINRGHLARLR
jgi:hypothetical protein